MDPEEKELSLEEKREQARQNRLKTQKTVKRSSNRQKRLVQLGGLVVGAILVIGVFIILNNSFSGGKADKVTSSENIGAISKLPQNNLVLGDANAPVTITEYADLQCPICKDASQSTIPYVIEKYVATGKAKLVFQNWQIIGPDSATAAQGVLAAGKQNKAWQFIENWYKNQGQENSGYVTDKFIEAVAKETKLDLKKFSSDRQSLVGATQKHLDQSDADAQKNDLTGTPSFVVSGKGSPEIIRSLPEETDLDKAVEKVTP